MVRQGSGVNDAPELWATLEAYSSSATLRWAYGSVALSASDDQRTGGRGRQVGTRNGSSSTGGATAVIWIIQKISLKR